MIFHFSFKITQFNTLIVTILGLQNSLLSLFSQSLVLCLHTLVIVRLGIWYWRMVGVWKLVLLGLGRGAAFYLYMEAALISSR
jgi:hypothetical protein